MNVVLMKVWMLLKNWAVEKEVERNMGKMWNVGRIVGGVEHLVRIEVVTELGSCQLLSSTYQ